MSRRADRPLSPHVTVYRWPLNALMSIAHRVTGTGLLLGALLVVWWLVAAAASEEYFRLVNKALTSPVGDLLMLGLTLAFWYHFCNGIRHLIWDTGAGFEDRSTRVTAAFALGGAVLLSVLTILLVR
ncbi:MAG: succinate dehydrogenase, cytochrome b556 subunit [Rhodobacteraceae bacterium]|nr:succinate dehydrogenase, cytochrome b556 subunit [Paracoccaceae bacterium]